MAERIIMPKAGMAMEEGKIVRWLVRQGETVQKGEPLLEIETDKVNMEVEATASGTLIKITAQEGDTVPVTRTIGYIGQPGETVADDTGVVRPGEGETDIFIYPGYRFKSVDALITNFHLPQSTLLMLVSALAGRERMLSVYREAVEQQYRFFSFGDAMLIL
mgnify:CR=1 FL=1